VVRLVLAGLPAWLVLEGFWTLFSWSGWYWLIRLVLAGQAGLSWSVLVLAGQAGLSWSGWLTLCLFYFSCHWLL